MDNNVKEAIFPNILEMLLNFLFFFLGTVYVATYCSYGMFFLQRKRSAVSGVKQEAQDVLGVGERLLDEANQLSDNINKEIEVLKTAL